MDPVSFSLAKPFQFISPPRNQEAYCDATIVCEGKHFKVHRMIISAHSKFLKHLFDTATVGIHHMLVHPVIVLPGVSKKYFETLLDYIYNGQVNIARSDLQNFKEAVTYLEIEGLEDGNCSTQVNSINYDPLNMLSRSVDYSEEVNVDVDQIDTTTNNDFKEEPIHNATSIIANYGIDRIPTVCQGSSEPMLSGSVGYNEEANVAVDQIDPPINNELDSVSIKEEPIHDTTSTIVIDRIPNVSQGSNETLCFDSIK